jgi:hypothetical protein
MKKSLNIVVLTILLLASFISCEEVIDIDLNTTNPKIVIEANISDSPGPYIVKLSKTDDFYEPSVFEKISDARVVISNNHGVVDTLYESEPGIYLTSVIEGIPGDTYSLHIGVENFEITAISTMPEKIELEKVNFDYILAPTPHDEDGYSFTCEFQDPQGIDNFYRFKVYKNDTLHYENKYDIYLWDDKYFDGNYTDLSIKRRGTFPFQINDSVKIELLTYNQETYMYYTTLINSITEYAGMKLIRSALIGSFAPANPKTNLPEEVVGYFAAYCTSEQEIVIE